MITCVAVVAAARGLGFGVVGLNGFGCLALNIFKTQDSKPYKRKEAGTSGVSRPFEVERSFGCARPGSLWIIQDIARRDLPPIVNESTQFPPTIDVPSIVSLWNSCKSLGRHDKSTSGWGK